MARIHAENHLLDRIGWLRAAVLGANDGIVSTSSLVIGVAAAGASPSAVMLTGTAGLVAGAMSMAAGEYVSVSSQADAESADIAKEKAELATNPAFEREELTAIYQSRGLDRALAEQVADQLMAKDALKAHLRDELGLTEEMAARPLQAAWASALAFPWVRPSRCSAHGSPRKRGWNGRLQRPRWSSLLLWARPVPSSAARLC